MDTNILEKSATSTFYPDVKRGGAHTMCEERKVCIQYRRTVNPEVQDFNLL